MIKSVIFKTLYVLTGFFLTICLFLMESLISHDGLELPG